eukprot:13177045-Heterocapsa_arctica.AAC.1
MPRCHGVSVFIWRNLQPESNKLYNWSPGAVGFVLFGSIDQYFCYFRGYHTCIIILHIWLDA